MRKYRPSIYIQNIRRNVRKDRPYERFGKRYACEAKKADILHNVKNMRKKRTGKNNCPNRAVKADKRNDADDLENIDKKPPVRVYDRGIIRHNFCKGQYCHIGKPKNQVAHAGGKT